MQTNDYRYEIKRFLTKKKFFSDSASETLVVQSDNMHLFDSVKVNTCDETCNVQDIAGRIELHTNGLDSGCNPEQCCMYLMKGKTFIEYCFFKQQQNENIIYYQKMRIRMKYLHREKRYLMVWARQLL
jgi:hypothetical protein